MYTVQTTGVVFYKTKRKYPKTKHQLHTIVCLHVLNGRDKYQSNSCIASIFIGIFKNMYYFFYSDDNGSALAVRARPLPPIRDQQRQ